jgi:hypothetical protein
MSRFTQAGLQSLATANVSILASNGTSVPA